MLSSGLVGKTTIRVHMYACSEKILYKMNPTLQSGGVGFFQISATIGTAS